MKQDYQFSIFIPSWNNLAFLKICVDSIRKNSAVKHQIIVHVNEGTDGTLQWVKEQPDIDYTYSPQNVGVCLSMNMMRTKASHPYIYFVNDDMYMLPGWDIALFEELNHLNSSIAFYISSSAIQPHEAPHPGTGLLADYGDCEENFREADLLRDYQQYFVKDWQGATRPPCLVHRDMWDIIGGYSIEFTPGYGSDPDFSAKLYMVGVRYFKGLGKSLTYHFESKTTVSVKANDYRTQFFLKWGTKNSSFRNFTTCMGRPWEENSHTMESNFKDKIFTIWSRIVAAIKIICKESNLLKGDKRYI